MHERVSAYGEVFEAYRVIPDTGWVRFMGIAVTGNVLVKRATDPDSFGAFCVPPEKAKELFRVIKARYGPRKPVAEKDDEEIKEDED